MTSASEKKGAIRFYPGAVPEELNGKGVELWSFCGITQEERDRFYRDLVVFEQLEDESVRDWQWRLYKDKVNLFALQWLISALNDDSRAYVQVDADSINFIISDKHIPEIKGQLIVLDGTSNKKEMDALFNRDFEVITGRVSLDHCTKCLIRRNLSKTRCKTIEDSQIEYLLREAVSALRPKDQKVLLATHQIIESRVYTILKSLLPERQIGSIHFYGNRGNNEFKDYDAVICFGAPGTNQIFRLDEAMALFPDDHDERIKWFARVADAELIQTVHRIRPVNGGKNIILLNKRWIPEFGTLDFEIDKRKGSDKIINTFNTAYERLEKFYLDHGFISIQIGYFLQIGHSDRKDLIQKLNSMVGSNSFLHLINIYIGEGTKKSGPLLLFSNKSYWSKLTEKLSLRHSSAILEHKAHSKWTKAVGSIDAAERFFGKYGLIFNNDNWRTNEQER